MARTQKPGMTTLEVVLPQDVKGLLDSLAKKQTEGSEGQKVFASDIMRKALQEHLKREYGLSVDVNVERGGYRPRKSDAKDETH
jgi:hypothetical protein